jgi:hypothetical protein
MHGASCSLNISFKDTNYELGCSTSTTATGKHIFEIAEKAPEQDFKDNHSISSSKNLTQQEYMQS